MLNDQSSPLKVKTSFHEGIVELAGGKETFLNHEKILMSNPNVIRQYL